LLNQMITKSVTLLCVFTLLLSPLHAYADNGEATARGKVSQLNEGQKAPFKGILLSPEAAAGLFADIKFSQKECDLKLDRELKLRTSVLNSNIDALTLRLEIEQKRTVSLLGIKNERIQFLEKNWQPEPWYQTGEFWLGTGVVLGIVITVASGYAIGQASK